MSEYILGGIKCIFHLRFSCKESPQTNMLAMENTSSKDVDFEYFGYKALRENSCMSVKIGCILFCG